MAHNLLQLHARKKARSDFSQTLSEVVERAMKPVLAAVTKDLKSRADAAEPKHIRQAVNAIEASLKSGIQSVLADIGKIETQDELKALLKGIRIPDHKDQFGRIEKAIVQSKTPAVDILPILNQLDTISDQLIASQLSETKEWTFKINRNRVTGFLDSVDVTAK